MGKSSNVGWGGQSGVCGRAWLGRWAAIAGVVGSVFVTSVVHADAAAPSAPANVSPRPPASAALRRVREAWFIVSDVAALTDAALASRADRLQASLPDPIDTHGDIARRDLPTLCKMLVVLERRALAKTPLDRAAVAATRARVLKYCELAARAGSTTVAPSMEYLYVLELEQSARLADAEKIYAAYAAAPKSGFAGLASFALGELSFAARDDAALDRASSHYQKALANAAPTDDGLYGYALLRLAQVDEARGRRADAMKWLAQLKRLDPKVQPAVHEAQPPTAASPR